MTAVAVERQEAVAHLKFARMGPRKLRRVADAIRGKTVREALVLLRFAGVFASEPIERLLKSAVANAENNHNMSGDGLYITKITVHGGPGRVQAQAHVARDDRRRAHAAEARAAPSSGCVDRSLHGGVAPTACRLRQT